MFGIHVSVAMILRLIKNKYLTPGKALKDIRN